MREPLTTRPLVFVGRNLLLALSVWIVENSLWHVGSGANESCYTKHEGPLKLHAHALVYVYPHDGLTRNGSASFLLLFDKCGESFFCETTLLANIPPAERLAGHALRQTSFNFCLSRHKNVNCHALQITHRRRCWRSLVIGWECFTCRVRLSYFRSRSPNVGRFIGP